MNIKKYYKRLNGQIVLQETQYLPISDSTFIANTQQITPINGVLYLLQYRTNADIEKEVGIVQVVEKEYNESLLENFTAVVDFVKIKQKEENDKESLRASLINHHVKSGIDINMATQMANISSGYSINYKVNNTTAITPTIIEKPTDTPIIVDEPPINTPIVNLSTIGNVILTIAQIDKLSGIGMVTATKLKNGGYDTYNKIANITESVMRSYYRTVNYPMVIDSAKKFALKTSF